MLHICVRQRGRPRWEKTEEHENRIRIERENRSRSFLLFLTGDDQVQRDVTVVLLSTRSDPQAKERQTLNKSHFRVLQNQTDPPRKLKRKLMCLERKSRNLEKWVANDGDEEG